MQQKGKWFVYSEKATFTTQEDCQHKEIGWKSTLLIIQITDSTTACHGNYL